MRTRAVITPRRVFASVAELARHLNIYPQVLYQGNYLELADGDAYALRPLDEAEYERWHRTVYAPEHRTAT